MNGILMTNFMARPRKTTLSLPAMANSKVSSVAQSCTGQNAATKCKRQQEQIKAHWTVDSDQSDGITLQCSVRSDIIDGLAEKY
jgi:hypothetical protein